jgi:hypothetical protein
LSRRDLLKASIAAATAGLIPGLVDFAEAQAPISDPLGPVALDGSPAQAFASHRARGNGIARHFALTRPLSSVSGEANEDNMVTLIAHLHAATEDPKFTPPGQVEPSATAAPKALRALSRGEGIVGTFGKYDFALKGLMTIAHRYKHLLNENQFNHILNTLIPGNISGGHPVEVEFLEVSFLNIDIPETENHLLMTESSRYLINQLFHERDPVRKFDNARNGLSEWLLGYMQTIAKHDFMEFNSRPYARLSLHSLYNLQEFAAEEEIRTAAQILLDYTMVKFALSSTRGRRVTPFRRLQPRINHQDNRANELYSAAGDQIAGCFLAHTGMTDRDSKPAHFPAALDYTGLIAGTSAYRPPPAAYILALKDDNPPSLHRFYHGIRPQVRASSDIAEGGLEIYYRSKSFLLSAGGMFLNSGYGSDELGQPIKPAWRDTARAQATTLIPARADVRFHELLRFEPYPDRFTDPYFGLAKMDDDEADRRRTFAVNIGVDRGLAAGANLRPAEKRTLAETTSAFPALAANEGGLFVAWKGSGNDNINLAKVQTATMFDIPGVEGIEQKIVLGETTDRSPALASLGNRLFLAWKGSGNDNLNLIFTKDGGKTFRGKSTFGETSHLAPAVVAHNGILFFAWTGRGEGNLNIAKVGFTPEANSVLVDKVVLGDTSEASPALASHNGRLFIAWRGSGNTQLNLAFSEDDGRTFKGKVTLADSSDRAPALISHEGRLYLAWSGRGNDKLNVARVVLIGNTAGAFGIEGLEAKVVLDDFSTQSPAIGSWNKLMFLAWKGEGDDNLNLRVSRDGSFQTPGPWSFSDLTHLGFYVATYRTPAAGEGDQDRPIDNLAIVYAVEKSDMDARGIDFGRFRTLTMRRNNHLPDRLEYGATYEFHAADDRNFSIWFKLTGDKYKARVVDLSNRVDNLAGLPLASGEFMQAPGGHNGLVEIRHPGSEQTPMILDYRDSKHPKREDNKASHPRPWIDRTLALFELAPQLERVGRPKDMHDALADAAMLYDETLRLNTDQNGPLLAPGVIKGLATMGVDFSVPQHELLQWLANPLFTPYPAIAQALLLLKRKLKAPVFLDVITFNYERAQGSPRTVKNVKARALRAAILKGFNRRYGTGERDFESILLPL